MEILCPTCQVRMERVTDPRGGVRRQFLCPQCGGEYVVPARPGRGDRISAVPAEPAPPPASPPTVPGFQLGSLPGADWQVPEELRFSLKVVEGTETGSVFDVTRSRVTVGREEGEILLADPLVSRKHAAFEVFGSQHIVIKDLASTNGTYLNGRLIAFSKLNNGDRIRLGSTVLEVVIQVGG